VDKTFKVFGAEETDSATFTLSANTHNDADGFYPAQITHIRGDCQSRSRQHRCCAFDLSAEVHIWPTASRCRRSTASVGGGQQKGIISWRKSCFLDREQL
jgi:hypothetical protein